MTWASDLDLDDDADDLGTTGALLMTSFPFADLATVVVVVVVLDCASLRVLRDWPTFGVHCVAGLRAAALDLVTLGLVTVLSLAVTRGLVVPLGLGLALVVADPMVVVVVVVVVVGGDVRVVVVVVVVTVAADIDLAVGFGLEPSVLVADADAGAALFFSVVCLRTFARPLRPADVTWTRSTGPAARNPRCRRCSGSG